MRIVSFDGVTFGRQNEQDGIAFEMATSQTRIPGADGAFDNHGDYQYREPFTFSRSFLLTGTAIHTDLDSLLSKTNRRGWLTLQTRGGVNRGTWAKLSQVSYDNTPEQVNYLPVKLTFSIPWPWLQLSSDGWFLDTGYVLDTVGLTFDGNYTTRTGTGSLSINNTGGGPISRGTIELTGTTTNPLITNNTNGWSVLYTGTVTSAQRLVIDLGAQTAVVDGVNVWADITLGVNQTGIMRYETGVNDIVYSNTSGAGGVIVIHWARVY